MRAVGASKAKNRLGAPLDLVEQGEEVVITRHGKPVARLVAAGAPRNVEAIRAAVDNIRALREHGVRGDFDWEEWKSYRDDGRR